MKHFISISVFIFLNISCQDKNHKNSQYRLVWSDEFEQKELAVDDKKWFMETITPNNGMWWNNELQHYTDRQDNAYVSNGTLKIVAKKEKYNFSGSILNYTSARLNSKFSFTYGKVLVRAKLPSAQGTWPAIWTLGSNFQSVGWPDCGEIDIMEQLFENFEMVQCAVHTLDNHGGNAVLKQVKLSDVTKNFHLYGLEWTPESLNFFIDGIEYFSYEPSLKSKGNWPFVEDQFILLNIAIGGNLGGNIDPKFSEDQMEIDYVRVYKKI